MLKEYALEPDCLKEWSTFRYLIENFGVPQGRLIAEFPKKWLRMVYESCGSFSFQQKQKLQIELTRIKKYGLCKTSRPYDGELEWLENAFRQQAENPFHAIIASEAVPENHVLAAEEVSAVDPLWNVQRTKVVPRRADDMALAVSKFLSIAKHIIFVDPHFGPENSRYRRAFRAFLQVATQNRNAGMPLVEVHTSAKSTKEFFRQECQNKLTRLIPAGLTVRFVRWAARDGGQPLHNRYILTDVGGVSFQHGLDEGRDGETDDVALLDQQNYQQRWSEYAGENPAFDLAEEPFVLSSD
ncbi:hypothetical protein EDC39_102208 [Geothermobacter ehrlichii]|uniref:Uncharacterized protein n=1 Tax=Geothermobacter ehrlichii TaxID=213224 RepID=A0A5D3WMM3_9BACT|nr:hypothetical protein [Geothermobacter ehrlichii]TYO99683.1 hypothetical protein EDC39_102208 [Geothermobacter ehrlichii]